MEFTKKQAKELADLRIKELHNHKATILAENTEVGFKELIVNGAQEYIIKLKFVEKARTKSFTHAHFVYRNMGTKN